MTLFRKEVFALVDGERDYQDAKYPTDDKGVSATPEGFLLVIEALVLAGKTAYVVAPTPKEKEAVMDVIRKIAATAVRAMEQHGAPERWV